MSKAEDVTGIIERLEAFEERLGVRFDAISAFAEEPDDYNETWSIEVKGELHTLEGTSIDNSLVVFLSAYDAEGRVVQTGQQPIWADDFFGLETFDMSLRSPVRVTKLRLIPKAVT